MLGVPCHWSLLLFNNLLPTVTPQNPILFYSFHITRPTPTLLIPTTITIMALFVSGEMTPPWTSFFSSFHSFVSSVYSFFLSNPSTIAILLTLTLVPFILWIDTIGKNSASSLNKMAVKDPSADFKGDIKVNNNPPTKGDLEKAADLPVLDQNRKKYTFKSLYADNENGPRQVLIIFIRHFFCGVCPPTATLIVNDADQYI